MPAFFVRIPDTATGPRFNNANAMVAFAADADDAKAICKARFDGDVGGSWDNAVVTEIVADADLEGWTARVQISGANPGPFEVEVVGAASETIDSIAAKLVTELNALASIAGAAYTATSQTLTVAAGSDNLGDRKLQVDFIPPATQYPGGDAIPGLVDSVTDEGATGDALTAVLAADGYALPAVYATVDDRS